MTNFLWLFDFNLSSFEARSRLFFGEHFVNLCKLGISSVIGLRFLNTPDDDDATWLVYIYIYLWKRRAIVMSWD